MKDIKLKVIGIKGTDGVDGKTPSTDELISLITPLIPKPIPGPQGDAGTSPKISDIEEIIKLH
jgi:hypothetical protein